MKKGDSEDRMKEKVKEAIAELKNELRGKEESLAELNRELDRPEVAEVQAKLNERRNLEREIKDLQYEIKRAEKTSLEKWKEVAVPVAVIVACLGGLIALFLKAK